MRNHELDDNLPPVTLPDAICGTDDRVLVAAALVMLAVVLSGVYLIYKAVKRWSYSWPWH